MGFLQRAPVRVGVWLLALFGALFAYAWRNPITPDSPRLFDPFRFKAEQIERFRNSLRDPDSARFSDDFVSGRKPPHAVCGKVNQRGEGGGFVGSRRFILTPAFQVTDADLPAGEMDGLWARLCGRPR